MQLSSVRDLKKVLAETVLASLSEPTKEATSLALPAGLIDRTAGPLRTIALGITSPRANEFRLAVRYQRPELETSKELEQIRKKAKGEVDVRYIGRVTKLAEPPWPRRRYRPLKLGTSIGHFQITAGTLGAVVRDKTDGAPLLLSNNHVLANENKAKIGDAVLQPAAFDGGTDPADCVATLAKVVKLKKTGVNFVDCAAAAPVQGVEADALTIHGLGKLAGLGPDFLDSGSTVTKLGRTTGLTRGRVRAFELDNVAVGFGQENSRYNLLFNNQIEIEGEGTDPFARGGDSGSLIVADDLRAVGLLFAVGDTGGQNGKGLTYASPIRAVLDALGVQLLL
jgi:hypothetical protein